MLIMAIEETSLSIRLPPTLFIHCSCSRCSFSLFQACFSITCESFRSCPLVVKRITPNVLPLRKRIGLSRPQILYVTSPMNHTYLTRAYFVSPRACISHCTVEMLHSRLRRLHSGGAYISSLSRSACSAAKLSTCITVECPDHASPMVEGFLVR